jgi:hypothetical protein
VPSVRHASPESSTPLAKNQGRQKIAAALGLESIEWLFIHVTRHVKNAAFAILEFKFQSVSGMGCTSKSENTNAVEIHAVEGKLYYIWQEVKMRFLYARTKLNLVSDEDGKKGVLETQLAETKQHKVKRCFAHQPPHK